MHALPNPGIELLHLGGRKAALGGALVFVLVLAGDWLAQVLLSIFQVAALVIRNVGQLLTDAVQMVGTERPLSGPSLLLAALLGLGTAVLIALVAYGRIRLLARVHRAKQKAL